MVGDHGITLGGQTKVVFSVSDSFFLYRSFHNYAKHPATFQPQVRNLLQPPSSNAVSQMVTEASRRKITAAQIDQQKSPETPQQKTTNPSISTGTATTPS